MTSRSRNSKYYRFGCSRSSGRFPKGQGHQIGECLSDSLLFSCSKSMSALVRVYGFALTLNPPTAVIRSKDGIELKGGEVSKCF